MPGIAGKAPAARSAHVAAAFQGRYLIVFGGGSVAHCFDNLFMLDTETMHWTELESEGPVPPPRAGERKSRVGRCVHDGRLQKDGPLTDWFHPGHYLGCAPCGPSPDLLLCRGWNGKPAVGALP